MKEAYNTLLSFLKRLPILLEIVKYNIFERIKLIRDRNVYSKPELSQEEKNKLQEYWKSRYGRKIDDKWHRYYMLYTGRFDVRYFPQILYSTKLEHRLNPWHYSVVLSDKNLLQSLFSDVVRCPIIYGKKCGRTYWGLTGAMSRSEFIKSASDLGRVVLKPTCGSSSGDGVRVCEFQNGIDKITGASIESVLGQYNRDYNIQEYIEQSDALSSIYNKSLNTFRVITYVANDHIFCAPIAMRFGAHGNVVDNIHAGGLMIGVSQEGQLNRYAYLEFGEKFESHPDSGIVFANYRIPSVSKIVETAKKLHAKIPQLGMVSWDFSLDKNDDVVLVEVNLKGQSVWFPQEVHGKSLFEENTEYMISLISKKKKRRME